MNCYHYERGDSGRLVACEDYGYTFMMRPMLDPDESRRAFRGRSRRERRRLARENSGRGRRRGVRVSRWPSATIPDPVRYDGHLLGFDDARVRLYLPRGAQVTATHLDDVTEIFMGRRQ
jgi:hypothetical protein